MRILREIVCSLLFAVGFAGQMIINHIQLEWGKGCWTGLKDEIAFWAAGAFCLALAILCIMAEPLTNLIPRRA